MAGWHRPCLTFITSTTTTPDAPSPGVSGGWWVAGLAITSAAGIIGAVAALVSASRAKSARTEVQANVGIVNGHGTVMEQLVALAEAQNRDATALTDHITHADRKLEVLHGRVSTLREELRDHVRWEMAQKYPSPPWDGVERRRSSMPVEFERRTPHDEGEAT